MPDFDSMNETDVREIIVRPLLEQLGYRHGTTANIRTEQPLKYNRAFLGRKNPKKDPPLAGRADYICDVISFGRWVVEVKAPGERLTQDVVEQAHTYAAHPEIAATHFMVTNGREFRLYQTARLDEPALSFPYNEIQANVIRLFNIVGPEAMRKRVKLSIPDPGVPLGLGVASRVEIIGGQVTYDDHESDSPLFDTTFINGLSLPVTGGFVERADDGRLRAYVQVAKAAPMFRDLSDLVSVDGYDFFAATEFISTEVKAPTIFQNLSEIQVDAGSLINMPGVGNVRLPFGFTVVSWTEAVGFVKGDTFKGTMHLSYDTMVTGLQPAVRAALEAQFGRHIPSTSKFEGAGSFEVRLRDGI